MKRLIGGGGTGTPGPAGTVSAAGSGTAAAPGIAFASDPNTGIYSPGADQLAVATNGVGRLFVDASGNVTINSSNASTSVLNFNATAANNIEFRLQIAGVTYAQFYQGFNDLNIINQRNGNLKLYTNNTERLRMTSAGLVGIGTSSPSALIDVSGSVNPGYIAEFINTGNSNNAKGLFIQAGLNNGFGNNVLASFNYGGTEAGYISHNTGTITYAAAGGLQFNTNSQQRVTIASAGNVGIGTSSPSKTLDVVGDAKIVTTASTQNILLGVSSGGIGYKTQIDFGHPTVGARIESERLGANTQSSLSFWTTSAAGVTGRALTIDASQRVGIGTTSPTAPLTVIGPDNSTQVVIGGSTGSTGRGLRIATALNGSNNETVIFDAQATTASPAFKWQLGGSDKMALDENGRLLIGTSSSSDNVRAVFTGNSASATDGGVVHLRRGGSAVSANTHIGTLGFAGGEGLYASIITQADATPGTGDSPGRLVFSTTADGAASPTERLRITSTGQVRLAGAGITFNGDTATANELDDYEEGTCLATTGTWTDYGSTYTKIGRMVYIEIRGDVATTPQAIALPFTFGDVCIGGYVIETTTFNGITSGVNASAAGTTITLPVGFIKGFLSYRAA